MVTIYRPGIPIPLTTTSETHEAIHKGLLFDVKEKHVGLANGESHEVLIKVPAGVFPNIITYDIHVGAGDIDVDFYRGTIVSADGAEKTPVNRNDSYTNTPDTTFFEDPTITDEGELVNVTWLPPSDLGTGTIEDGIIKAGGDKRVLKESTNYLNRITNLSGNTIDVWYKISFIEEGAAT